jgi:catechol 2,3-dioxygenase-like lactoylglutathione lyase family enzyme
MADNALNMQLHTMMLRVANLAKSVEWYGKKIGMTIFHEDVPYKIVSLMGESGNRITLWELRDGERPTETTRETAYAVFNTTNAFADHRTLVARGVDATKPEDTGLGIRFFWITDPDRHRHCVIEFLPE